MAAGVLGVGGVSGFSASFSAGGGGKIVASMDSGGATSGVLIGKLGADQSRAMMVPWMVKLSAVLHHERGRSLSVSVRVRFNRCVRIGNNVVNPNLSLMEDYRTLGCGLHGSRFSGECGKGACTHQAGLKVPKR